jgi:hypothetical protein
MFAAPLRPTFQILLGGDYVEFSSKTKLSLFLPLVLLHVNRLTFVVRPLPRFKVPSRYATTAAFENPKRKRLEVLPRAVGEHSGS